MKKQTTIILTLILGLTAFVTSGIAQDSIFDQQIKPAKPQAGSARTNTPSGAMPPANDNLANAIPMVLVGGSASVATNNIAATKETGEPDHAENIGGKSAWFSFTPTETKPIRINTYDTNFDTLLAVYTGNSVNDLQLIGFNDDCNGGCGASTVDLMMTTGTTYYIAVDGYNDGITTGEGNFKIALLDNNIPYSDDLAGAYYLGTSHRGSIAGTNYNATRQADEPIHYNLTYPGAKSVWYRWSPSGDFSAMVELTENFDSVIAVYSATINNPTFAQLTPVMNNKDSFGYTDSRYRVKFFAENSKTYYIAVAGNAIGNAIQAGNFQLNFRPNKLRYSADYEWRDDESAISVFRPSDGIWYSINGFNHFPNYVQWGANGDTPVPADYDGNGSTDRAVVRNQNGAKIWYIYGTLGPYAVQWGLASDKAVTGDFDYDGRADQVVIRNSGQNLVWYVRRSSDGAMRTFTFGAPFDKPVLGDFDGDGGTDVAVIRNTQSGWVWHFLNGSSYNHYSAVQFGMAPDVPAVEDFDGDGKTDIAVFRPSTGVWYILQSGNGQVRIDAFGFMGDKPQPADYNGDGKADLAVFRPSDGTWYIAKPTGVPAQNFYAIPWGMSTDLLVSSMTSLSQ